MKTKHYIITLLAILLSPLAHADTIYNFRGTFTSVSYYDPSGIYPLFTVGDSFSGLIDVDKSSSYSADGWVFYSVPGANLTITSAEFGGATAGTASGAYFAILYGAGNHPVGYQFWSDDQPGGLGFDSIWGFTLSDFSNGIFRNNSFFAIGGNNGPYENGFGRVSLPESGSSLSLLVLSLLALAGLRTTVAG